MLSSLFFRLFKRTALFDKYFYFGEKFIDKEIESFVDYDHGFFVELGANDGVNQSNTLHFEKFRNWKGVLIEPSPNNFINCLKVRSPDTSVFCNACVSFDFKEKYVDMNYDNLMTTAEDIEPGNTLLTLDHKWVSKPGKKKNFRYRYGAVPATLNSILNMSGAPREIDFLSLDVEGAEIMF